MSLVSPPPQKRNLQRASFSASSLSHKNGQDKDRQQREADAAMAALLAEEGDGNESKDVRRHIRAMLS